jgi:hypothetical protein
VEALIENHYQNRALDSAFKDVREILVLVAVIEDELHDLYRRSSHSTPFKVYQDHAFGFRQSRGVDVYPFEDIQLGNRAWVEI